MVATKEEAKAAYRRGVEGFGGASSYIECGKKKGAGALAVAKCLEEKKEVKLTTDLMVEKYGAKL